MSEYNDTDTVVSYRAIFSNAIEWELFDMAKNKRKITMLTNDSGTVIAVKQVSLPSLKQNKIVNN